MKFLADENVDQPIVERLGMMAILSCMCWSQAFRTMR